jgi:hypothetical protein
VAQVFGLKASAVPALEAVHGRQLRFWALTQPSFRNKLLGDEESVSALESLSAPKVSKTRKSALDSLA